MLPLLVAVALIAAISAAVALCGRPLTPDDD